MSTSSTAELSSITHTQFYRRFVPYLPPSLCFLVTSSPQVGDILYIGIIQCSGQGKGTITLTDEIILLYIFKLEDKPCVDDGTSNIGTLCICTVL